VLYKSTFTLLDFGEIGMILWLITVVIRQKEGFDIYAEYCLKKTDAEHCIDVIGGDQNFFLQVCAQLRQYNILSLLNFLRHSLGLRRQPDTTWSALCWQYSVSAAEMSYIYIVLLLWISYVYDQFFSSFSLYCCCCFYFFLEIHPQWHMIPRCVKKLDQLTKNTLRWIDSPVSLTL